MTGTAVLDDAAFDDAVRRHRGELRAHCYRMLGSVGDAEDAVQEALLSAWRGRESFQGRSSVRTWLYRIATNACLKLAERRPRRMLSYDAGPSRTDVSDLGEPVPGPVWIEPWLGAGDDPAGPGELSPEASYLRRESIELAYVAALQALPPNQRAVLILRDVLAFSADEVAAMLDTTAASVTSALQRARASAGRRAPSQQDEIAALGSNGDRAVVDAFVAAWEARDLGALLELLTEDVRFTMPPLPAWFDGLAAVRAFIAERAFATPWRLVPTTVNAQPGLVCYQWDGTRYALGAVNALGLRDGRICWIAGFVDPPLLRDRFGLPEESSG